MRSDDRRQDLDPETRDTFEGLAFACALSLLLWALIGLGFWAVLHAQNEHSAPIRQAEVSEAA